MYEARNTRTKKNILKLIGGKKEREFIIFDTETTGLKPDKDFIVEFAGIKCKAGNGHVEEIAALDEYIRPPFYMAPDVIDVHQITNEFLEDKPAEAYVYPDIKEFIGEKPILLAYNADFDISMLQAMYERQDDVLKMQVVIDVLEAGRDVIKDSEDYKLGTLVTDLGLSSGLTFHNALDDTRATMRLLAYCYEEYLKEEDGPKERVYINSAYFWKGKNKYQSGVYVKSNLGVIYYSTFLKRWRSSVADLSKVDIDALEDDVTRRLGCSYKEIYKMTQKKYDTLIEKKKK